MKNYFVYFAFLFFVLTSCNQEKRTQLSLDIDITDIKGDIDLTKYSLGQGGLSSEPMIDAHIPQIKNLQPQTIRFFIQEYFNVYPEKGTYNWEKLDKTLDAIVATGAKPIPAICFKPRVLFPKIDQTIVHPSNYAEWEELVYQLVKHCNEKNYGIEYWEIGNEVDVGEIGACPYIFTPKDYNIYYKHTSDAILKADSNAKIGGPVLGLIQGSVPSLGLVDNHIGDSLIAFCARENVVLDFFSFHLYNSEPYTYAWYIQKTREKLAKYPQFKDVNIMITEWNNNISNHSLDPAFQPAFILDVTKIFHDEQILSSAYYQIRDVYIDKDEFNSFISPNITALIMDLFNLMPPFGIFDNQGRVRPSYFVFKALSQQKGQQLNVKGTNSDIKSLTTKSGNWVYSIFWNFPSKGDPEKKYTCPINYKELGEKGRFRVLRINSESALNNIEEIRVGLIEELKEDPITITLDPYEIKWIELSLF